MRAPSGTVTFLFTDIEGSTRLWQAGEGVMRAALSRHDELLRKTVAEYEGVVFSSTGDGIAAVFRSASLAVGAALMSQRLLAAERWPTAAPIRVRMGIHTGEVEARDGDYFGTAVNRTARLMAVGHGGQVLCSSVTAELLDDGVALVDVGEHRLRDLDRPMHVFQVGAGSFAPLRSLDSFLGNLPLQVSSFVGRERELARGVEALGSSRVVTLTGVGGVGKTRLALQLAAEVLPGFRDGAWLVELAAVRVSEGVAEAVAAVFGLAARGSERVGDAVMEFLRTKQMLLVLDNCEHLVDGVADLVDAVEKSCGGVVVLATSREGLAVEGERILAVPSLAVPDVGVDVSVVGRSEAVALFVERARHVDADFVLSVENAASVAQVCRRLDGVPLAVELAAARVNTMTPSELARALDHRFETLAGGRRRAVPRHQTLRAAIDWSYELCSEPEQRLLARLAVFSGGCTRQSAEAVCAGEPLAAAEVFSLLVGLVAKSLVVAERDHPESRYRLLETIREYGAERRAAHGETEALRARHGQHFVDLARSLILEADGPDLVEAVRRLDAEEENLLAAMANAVDAGDVDVALGLLTGNWGHGAIIMWGPVFPTECLRLEGAADHPLYPAALVTAAIMAGGGGEHRLAEDLCAAALAAAERLGSRDPLLDFQVAAALGGAESVVGAFGGMARYMEQATEIARSEGLVSLMSGSLGTAAVGHSLAGDLDQALPLATEGLALARQLGNTTNIVWNLIALAGALTYRDPEQARDLLRESMSLLAPPRGVSHVHLLHTALLGAARVGDWDTVLEASAPAIRDYYWRGERARLGGVLTIVTRAVVAFDQPGAARLQGAARRLLSGVRPPRAAPVPEPGRSKPGNAQGEPAPRSSGIVAELRQQASDLLAETLGTDRLRELRAEGEAMNDDQVLSTAFDLIAAAQSAAHP